jgi:hypothetical protein
MVNGNNKINYKNKLNINKCKIFVCRESKSEVFNNI